MIFVYALFDRKSSEIYVGMTNNIERKVAEHRRGQSKYTRKFKSIECLLLEEYASYGEGRKREKYLKSGCGKEFLKEILKNAGVV